VYTADCSALTRISTLVITELPEVLCRNLIFRVKITNLILFVSIQHELRSSTLLKQWKLLKTDRGREANNPTIFINHIVFVDIVRKSSKHPALSKRN
jgi:hypothetical protein